MKTFFAVILAVGLASTALAQEKARAVSESSTIEAVISQDLGIDCKAQGNPGPPELMIFTWKRNDQDIRIVSKATDSNGHAMDQLMIRNISVMDAGVYECHPKNPIGEYNFTHYTIQVGFLEPPVINSANFSEISTNGSIVTICWEPVDTAAYPGLVIEHYEIEVLLVTPQDTEIIKSVLILPNEWQNCTNIRVEGDVDDNRYGARVNAFGRGGRKLTSGTDYTTVNRHRTYTEEIWWVILLITLFALIAACTLCCLCFICCVFLCPAILGREWKSNNGDIDLREKEKKAPKKRPATPDSVSSV